MESEAFRAWRAEWLTRGDARESRTSDAASTSTGREPVIGLGKFARVEDYIAHYLSFEHRRVDEDYLVYCLFQCERARDEGEEEEEFYYYGELVRADARAALASTRRGEGEHQLHPPLRDLVDGRLRRVMDLGIDLEARDASAGVRSQLVASEYYAWFRDDAESALEHAGLVLRFSKALEDKKLAIEYEIDALKVMRSTQAREGNMYEAVALGTRLVTVARRKYYVVYGAELENATNYTAQETVRFVERLFEFAMTLRGWRERPGRPLTAPELERYASDILKEAKSALEEHWVRTSTTWRDSAVARRLYVATLCHLADLCENHLDACHSIVVHDDIDGAFSSKSRTLHRALAVGYRALASTIEPRLFERGCPFCGQPLIPTSILATATDSDPTARDGADPDRDAVALVTLACGARAPHHVHARCRLAAVDADDAHVDRSLERGLPCRFCAHEDDDDDDDDG